MNELQVGTKLSTRDAKGVPSVIEIKVKRLDEDLLVAYGYFPISYDRTPAMAISELPHCTPRIAMYDPAGWNDGKRGHVVVASLPFYFPKTSFSTEDARLYLTERGIKLAVPAELAPYDDESFRGLLVRIGIECMVAPRGSDRDPSNVGRELPQVVYLRLYGKNDHEKDRRGYYLIPSTTEWHPFDAVAGQPQIRPI